MGSKYKKALEIEWDGRGTHKIKAATIQVQADKNISEILKGKYKRRGCY